MRIAVASDFMTLLHNFSHEARMFFRNQAEHEECGRNLMARKQFQNTLCLGLYRRRRLRPAISGAGHFGSVKAFLHVDGQNISYPLRAKNSFHMLFAKRRRCFNSNTES